jgi:peptide/nickel transport system substrate-binding protein
MREVNRKDIALWVMILALGVSIISNIVIISNYPQPFTSRDHTILVRATSSGPHTLEIVDSWDTASNDVLEQVVETLFSHDLRDPNLPRINLLAESYYWENKTTLQIKLRKGVIFHDGTSFNASAVKWNLDRLQYLINATGTNINEVAQTRSLWLRPDGKTPIINNTAILGEFNVTIALNGAYGPFLNLLTCINAGMISPTFHEVNERSFIPLSGDLCGTGPFAYNSYTPDVKVVLSRWEGYWRHVAYFKKLEFKIFDDSRKAHAQMLNGQIDLNAMASYEDINAYEKSEDITVKHFTDDTGIPSLIYYFLSINNEKFNQTWRKVMSYAINYTYITEILRSGNAVRANSPISPAFGPPYNQSAKAPNHNITKAREIMVSMGNGDMGWINSQWIAKAEGSTPFLTIDYYYNDGNIFREDLGIALVEWFKLVGINVELETYENDDWCYLPYLCPPLELHSLELFLFGWTPDYLDPLNMLNPLINPNSDYNYANINDTKLNSMITLALETTDDITRDAIFKNIQGYFIESCFQIPLWHTKVIFTHSASLRNFPYNAMGKLELYGVYRV